MTLFQMVLTLLLLMDPLGNVPIFISILKHIEKSKRVWIIFRESFIAFVILLLFLFAGDYIMDSLQITEPAITIAGGIILFLISLKMVFPQTNQPLYSQHGEPFIVPLAIPLLAGPSAIAMVMVLAAQESEQTSTLFFAVVLSSAITALILMLSNRLQNLLGDKGLIALERLMGMILIILSVQMFLNGLAQYIHSTWP